MNPQQGPSKIVQLVMQVTGVDERKANTVLLVTSVVIILLSVVLFYRTLAPSASVPTDGEFDPGPVEDVAI